MNGKKAKQLRKVGKVAKRDKKLYNSLSHGQKEMLGYLYNHILEKGKTKS
jgi:hypothetical protein